jgi:hypothetical protein
LLKVIGAQEFEAVISFWIDQWMLRIGEVWYFSSKTGVFSRNDGSTMLCDEQHCLF